MMRNIDMQMADAFTAQTPFKYNNTEVKVLMGEDKQVYRVEVYLHGNRIAYMDSDMRPQIDLKTLAKWPTNVTMNRLRALGFDVCRRNGKTLVDDVEI